MIERKYGFAAMTPERRREIAMLGGQRAHQMGKAHRFTPEEARAAGKKSRRGPARKGSVEAVPVSTSDIVQQS